MTGVFVTATFLSVAGNIPFLVYGQAFQLLSYLLGIQGVISKKIASATATGPARLDHQVLPACVAGLALVTFSYFWFTQRGMWGVVPLIFWGFLFV